MGLGAASEAAPGAAALGPDKGRPARGGFASAALTELLIFGKSGHRDVARVGDAHTHPPKTLGGRNGLWEGNRGVPGVPRSRRLGEVPAWGEAPALPAWAEP